MPPKTCGFLLAPKHLVMFLSAAPQQCPMPTVHEKKKSWLDCLFKHKFLKGHQLRSTGGHTKLRKRGWDRAGVRARWAREASPLGRPTLASPCSPDWALSPHTNSDKAGLGGLFTKRHERVRETAREEKWKGRWSYSNSWQNWLNTLFSSGKQQAGCTQTAQNATVVTQSRIKRKHISHICSLEMLKNLFKSTFIVPSPNNPPFFFPGSFAPLRLPCWRTSSCGTCLLLNKGRSPGTWSFTASSSQCRRFVHHVNTPQCFVSSYVCVCARALTVHLCPFAVLPCAIFSPHHVHQQRPEREGLRHRLSYVSAPVWSDAFNMCDVVGALMLISVPPSGMMVEVLGTVLGTAIQGQIVGGASDCPAEPDVIDDRNATKINTSSVTLDETVSEPEEWWFSQLFDADLTRALVQAYSVFSVLRNMPTWLLQGSSASSTSSVPQSCFWVWRRKKVWSNKRLVGQWDWNWVL